MYNFYKFPYSRNHIPPPPTEKPPLPSPCPPSFSHPKKKIKKVDIKELKKNTCKSLNDVEHFLCNFNSFIKYIKLYNFLKK